MVWMHKIIWVCGKPVFKWVLVTKIEWARTAHFTGKMIALKAAKYKAATIAGGAIIGCTGTVAPVAWGIRHYGASSIGGGGASVTVVPEPSTLAMLAVAVVVLALIRRRA